MKKQLISENGARWRQTRDKDSRFWVYSDICTVHFYQILSFFSTSEIKLGKVASDKMTEEISGSVSGWVYYYNCEFYNKFNLI